MFIMDGQYVIDIIVHVSENCDIFQDYIPKVGTLYNFSFMLR